MYELTRCSNGRDLRALQYEPIQILTQIILADQPVFADLFEFLKISAVQKSVFHFFLSSAR